MMGFSRSRALAGALFSFALLEQSLGADPPPGGEWSGNWTTHTCGDHDGLYYEWIYYTPTERWSQWDCESAWNDALSVWRTQHRNKMPQMTFSASIWDTLRLGESGRCETLHRDNHCDLTDACGRPDEVGPPAAMIRDALGLINQFFHGSVSEGAGFMISSTSYSQTKVEKDFGQPPDPGDELTHQFLMDTFAIGPVMIAAADFEAALKTRSYFIANNISRNAVRDLTEAALSVYISTIKDFGRQNPAIHQFAQTKSSHLNFTEYLAQVLPAWSAAAESAVKKQFDGTDESIHVLTTLMSDGKLASGYQVHPTPDDPYDLHAWSNRVFWTCVFAAIWGAPESGVFVLDSGYACDHIDPLTPRYMDAHTANSTLACYDNKSYYLVRPGDGLPRDCSQQVCGDAGGCVPTWNCVENHFVAPTGLGKLSYSGRGRRDYGYVIARDVIVGSVRTYESNGRKNGAGPLNVDHRPTLDAFMDQDITTPGLFRIPVCGPEEAHENWVQADKTGKRYPGFPCNKVE